MGVPETSTLVHSGAIHSICLPGPLVARVEKAEASCLDDLPVVPDHSLAVGLGRGSTPHPLGLVHGEDHGILGSGFLGILLSPLGPCRGRRTGCHRSLLRGLPATAADDARRLLQDRNGARMRRVRHGASKPDPTPPPPASPTPSRGSLVR